MHRGTGGDRERQIEPVIPTTNAALDEVIRSHALAQTANWSPAVCRLLIGRDAPLSLTDATDAVDRLFPAEIAGALLPLAIVDEASLACTVANHLHDGYRTLVPGDVVRVFVTVVDARDQLALLDLDPLVYVASLEEELAARSIGLERVLDQIGPAYKASHLVKDKRPRDFVVRPVRIACQNVIVALGAIAQDSSFDGLSVPAWQTCEVPHVATHEANRALAALMLCDAFQNGGTMEIRFDRKARILHAGAPLDYNGHPEKQVPASLRRLGRTVGVTLGADDPAAITPSEARDLFMAITPMPADLRARVDDAVDHRGIAPERICYLLLSQVWREIEMDYLIATSNRICSILAGGSDWTARLARQAESEICRSAITAGMLFRRLNSTDSAATTDASAIRVVEDRKKGVEWTVHPDVAAVTLTGLDPNDPVPWTGGLTGIDTLTVFPRTAITPDVELGIANADVPGHKALLVPTDALISSHHGSVTVLRCPERLADIDKAIEERLLRSRVSRG